MSTHYPNLAAKSYARCDHCNGLVVDDFRVGGWQAYRRADGFVFLCATCFPAHHAAYHATRLPSEHSGSVRTPTATELSIRYPADRPAFNDRIRRR